MFDHEKLDVYRLALELDRLLGRVVPRRGCHAIRDQVERASASVVLCIAEGAGRRSTVDKRHFYSIARGSATECAAALDVLAGRNLIPQEARAEARALLLSIVRMLTRLADRLSPSPSPSPAPDASSRTQPPDP